MAHSDYPSRTGSLRGCPQTLTALLRGRAADQAADLAFGFLSDGETVRDRMTYADLDRQAGQIAGLVQHLP